MSQKGDSTLSGAVAHLNSQILLIFISSLYKKDLVQNTSIFDHHSGDILVHIKSV